MFLEEALNEFMTYSGGPLPSGIIPPGDIASRPKEERAAFGIIDDEDFAPADPLPEGKVANGEPHVARVDGVLKWVQPVKNAPQPTVAQRREQAIADLKQKRWEVEVGGIMVGDIPVSTARGDDRFNLLAQFSAIGAGLRVDRATFNFADGQPRSVSNADMGMIVGAVLGHVQAAFDRENVVTGLLNDAGTHAAMDAAIAEIGQGWPS